MLYFSKHIDSTSCLNTKRFYGKKKNNDEDVSIFVAMATRAIEECKTSGRKL